MKIHLCISYHIISHRIIYVHVRMYIYICINWCREKFAAPDGLPRSSKQIEFIQHKGFLGGSSQLVSGDSKSPRSRVWDPFQVAKLHGL